jgi:AraC-like DNA-binding protein
MPDAPLDSAYRELAPRAELRGHLACVWSLDPAARRKEVVLPDGCMDIVWRQGFGLLAAGPDTGPVTVPRRPGSAVVGVRFRPSAGPALLAIPARELRDLRVPLTELWGTEARRLEERLAEAGSIEARQELMQDVLMARMKTGEPPDRLVVGAVAMLRGDGLGRVNGLGDAIGISERQLRRRFHAAVGYGPKTLARVLRFQRMLALAPQGADGDLARLALEAGYADQAHMTAECTRLSGEPPARLLRSRIAIPASA